MKCASWASACGIHSNKITETMEGAEQWVTRQWSEVTRTVGRLSNNVLWTFRAIRNFFQKIHWTVTWQWSEVTRPSADCQTTFLDVSSNLENFWKKSLNGHATKVGGHATVGRLSNARFLDVSSNSENFWKKSLNGHATVVGGHATVGRLSNNVFWTFQAIRKIFVKSHWTVTRQWSKVTRPSADCQAHICMNKREWERESPLHFIRAPPCCAVGRFISRRPRWSWLLPVWKRHPLTRVCDRQGQVVYEYCKSSHWQV